MAKHNSFEECELGGRGVGECGGVQAHVGDQAGQRVRSRAGRGGLGVADCPLVQILENHGGKQGVSPGPLKQQAPLLAHLRPDCPAVPLPLQVVQQGAERGLCAQLPGDDQEAPGRLVVHGHHGLVEQRQGHPVRRVLEPGHVQDQRQVAGLVVGCHWAEVAGAGLAQHAALVVEQQHEALPAAGGEDCSPEERQVEGAPLLQPVCPGLEHHRVAAVEPGQMLQLPQGSFLKHCRLHPLQVVLVGVSPDPLPLLARVDVQCV